MPGNDRDPWAMHIRVADMPRNTPARVEEAIRRLSDELAIRDLIIRYTYYHDAGLLEKKLALHHGECVLHHNAGDLLGVHAIRAFYEAGPPHATIRDMKHHVTNTLVRFLADDRAVATSFFVWTETKVLPDASTRAAVGGGWYVDVVGRFGDDWLFVDRTIHRGFDFYLPGVASFGALQMGVEGLPAEAIERLRTSGLLG